MTAVFLAEHVSGMDDAAVQRFVTEQAGLELGDGGKTVARRETHVFLNFGFDAPA